MSKAHLQMTDLVSGGGGVGGGQRGRPRCGRDDETGFGDKHVHAAADEKREQRKTRREGRGQPPFIWGPMRRGMVKIIGTHWRRAGP